MADVTNAGTVHKDPFSSVASAAQLPEEEARRARARQRLVDQQHQREAQELLERIAQESEKRQQEAEVAPPNPTVAEAYEDTQDQKHHDQQEREILVFQAKLAQLRNDGSVESINHLLFKPDVQHQMRREVQSSQNTKAWEDARKLRDLLSGRAKTDLENDRKTAQQALEEIRGTTAAVSDLQRSHAREVVQEYERTVQQRIQKDLQATQAAVVQQAKAQPQAQPTVDTRVETQRVLAQQVVSVEQVRHAEAERLRTLLLNDHEITRVSEVLAANERTQLMATLDQTRTDQTHQYGVDPHTRDHGTRSHKLEHEHYRGRGNDDDATNEFRRREEEQHNLSTGGPNFGGPDDPRYGRPGGGGDGIDFEKKEVPPQVAPTSFEVNVIDPVTQRPSIHHTAKDVGGAAMHEAGKRAGTTQGPEQSPAVKPVSAIETSRGIEGPEMGRTLQRPGDPNNPNNKYNQ